ncbi:3-dehydroquinate synthase [Staphylococcus aureus]|nr:3-dehydroquinate synthase [Staphylococcus aureus]
MKLQTTYPSNNYPIYVEHGAIKYISTYIDQFDQSFILIDEHVNQYFADKFDDILSYENVHKVIIPAGEKTKTFEQYQETLEYILSHHVTRNTAIIAVGGGATGDFAGFVAATLLRGVHFIQVPTTILAHDSSVGGKVGINSKQGKNLIGAFYRPTAVIYDLVFLKTLPFEQYQETLEYILSHHVTRNTAIIAVGGGATGDFAGFVAATLLRGVHFIQVPTTILAHDSSVGGKVGINSKQGKNLIGAFYRPTAVIYDLDFLKTLPFEQILSGYAEVYKHALLNGESATQDIEQHFKDREILQSLNGMDKYIAKGIETKLDIVIADEKEQGVRKFLNLGHTFGHAVEYYHKIPHGHAVMVGIIYQFIVANALFDSKHDINHYIQYLIQLGYPLDTITDLDFETLYQYMLSDKKNDKQGVQMVLIRQFGDIVVQHVDQLTLQHACEQLKTYFK